MKMTRCSFETFAQTNKCYQVLRYKSILFDMARSISLHAIPCISTVLTFQKEILIRSISSARKCRMSSNIYYRLLSTATTIRSLSGLKTKCFGVAKIRLKMCFAHDSCNLLRDFVMTFHRGAFQRYCII